LSVELSRTMWLTFLNSKCCCKVRRLLIIIICCVSFNGLSAPIADTISQTKAKVPTIIKVKGTVVEKRSGGVIPNTLIIQKGIGGRFVKPNGTFEIKIRKTDTLLISALGYNVQRFCFKDSLAKTFTINIKLEKLQRELAEAVVMPKRVLSEIHEDFDQLRLKLPSRPQGFEAISSPITALYETFSKMAKSKRVVARLEYQDQKNDLLKELFQIYVDADVINLSPDEFQNFIYFCNVTDNFLKYASEYQLITFFQSRYKEFVALKQ